jgi:hypothetical protein
MLVFPIPGTQIETQKQQKKKPGNRYEKKSFLIKKYPKNSQNGSPKSSKNQ